MGVRGLISSVFHRDKKDRARAKRGSGETEERAEASRQSESGSQAPILAADPEENSTANKPEHDAEPVKVTGRRRAGSSVASPRGSSQSVRLEARPPEDSAAVTPITGLRKPSGEPRRPSPEHLVAPSEYLYFGDGSPPAHNITGHARTGSSSSSQKASKTTKSEAAAPVAYDATGNDGSGFPTTALSSSQTNMGYQQLTYSGSVQYDYTGGHGQGAFASAGSHGSAAFGY
ncbi:hypothetical protein GQ53DRAFT_748870 [Thozetella sp. PMI_491]|nr:hypothetical protein GQ53DRAFT_748870 [Thozetella sp. PMI_491]